MCGIAGYLGPKNSNRGIRHFAILLAAAASLLLVAASPGPRQASWVGVASVRTDSISHAFGVLKRARIPAIANGSRGCFSINVDPKHKRRAIALLSADAKTNPHTYLDIVGSKIKGPRPPNQSFKSRLRG